MRPSKVIFRREFEILIVIRSCLRRISLRKRKAPERVGASGLVSVENGAQSAKTGVQGECESKGVSNSAIASLQPHSLTPDGKDTPPEMRRHDALVNVGKAGDGNSGASHIRLAKECSTPDGLRRTVGRTFHPDIAILSAAGCSTNDDPRCLERSLPQEQTVRWQKQVMLRPAQ